MRRAYDALGLQTPVMGNNVNRARGARMPGPGNLVAPQVGICNRMPTAQPGKHPLLY